MLSIIAAISENYVIGKNNKLLWHMPADLKRFKDLTTGHTIIMGRKTFESLGKVLPERKHVVLTRDMDYSVKDKNVEVVHDIELLKEYIEAPEEVFVIGGAIIYRQLMPKVNKMYITRIHEKFDGDAYFPVIHDEEWKVIEKEENPKDSKNPYDYDFVTYERR